MPVNENAQQIEYWNGTTGERWMRYQHALDRTLGPLGEVALQAAHIVPGARVLDVGCGCGDTVLALADRVGPHGWVTGVDVSEPMLARARERIATRAPGSAVIELQLGDAAGAALPYDLDLIFSRFGVMFFADPKAAFLHLAQFARPGADLAFVCWQRFENNPWAHVPVQAMKPFLSADPPSPPGAPGPFAFADADHLRAILEPRFADVNIEPHEARLVWTPPSIEEAIDFFTNIGPSARPLREATPEARTRALAALADALRPHLTPDGLVLGTAVWIVTARC